jgi:glycerophosphoryl diester phosphodiesterase
MRDAGPVTSPAVKRIGHKGADHIAPGNTLESFDAALAHGVDMVEFDVLPERPDGSGRLVLAHDVADAARPGVLTLEEGLAHFAQDAWAGVELDVDLKATGYEERVVEALREHGLLHRVLVSTMERPSLHVLRAHAPELRLGWSVPRMRRNPLSHPVTRVPALALLQVARQALPRRAAQALRRGEADALMAHWAFVTPRLVRSVAEAGGELYVWTVDDAARIAAFERLGVTGVITNDPRLFSARSRTPVGTP